MQNSIDDVISNVDTIMEQILDCICSTVGMQKA